MEIKQLRYFVAVVEAGNITHAAQSLHIAQPALSYHILNLERDLQTTLLNRGVQGVTPTATGDILYRQATAILRHLSDVRAAVRQESESPSGRVAVGIPGSTARVLAIPLLRKLEAYPDIVLEIVERQSGEIATLVAQGHLDMAINVDAHTTRGVKVTSLAHEEMYAILPPTGIKPMKFMTLESLASFPLVLPSVPNLTRIKLDLAFLEAHLSYRLLAEVSTTDLLTRIVHSGLACTVLPWSAVSDEVRAKRLRAIPMEPSTMTRELSLCVSESFPLTQAAQIVWQLIVDTAPRQFAQSKWYTNRP